jgi:ribonuclease P protein component
VSKRVGNAVIRNYEKRTIREIFRKLIPTFKVSFDLIVILKRNGIDFFEKEKFFVELVREIEKILLEKRL